MVDHDVEVGPRARVRYQSGGKFVGSSTKLGGRYQVEPDPSRRDANGRADGRDEPKVGGYLEVDARRWSFIMAPPGA